LAKVLVLSPIPEAVIGMLFAEQAEKSGIQVEFVTLNEDDPGLLRKEVEDADVVIGDYTFKVPITRELVGAMKRVKLVAQPSTGYDHIDVGACRERGIPVSNIGGANAVSVAEHTLTLALMLMKRVEYSHRKLLGGSWVQGELLEVISELHGKTWGVIGLGRIGREVASRARALGADVVYNERTRLVEADESKLGVKFSELRPLLSDSDVVSIHVPLYGGTKGMMGEEEFRLMKSSSVFVNVSRGELADEAALAKAVSEKWIGGAGVDVFTEEPVPPDNPLVAAAKEGANIILTPHTAGATSDARLRIIQVTVENVVRVLTGREPVNVVNRQAKGDPPELL
jgi:phosphoglycerate dehydrogenase-like enzyme